jgi:hypothetical protein
MSGHGVLPEEVRLWWTPRHMSTQPVPAALFDTTEPAGFTRVTVPAELEKLVQAFEQEDRPIAFVAVNQDRQGVVHVVRVGVRPDEPPAADLLSLIRRLSDAKTP